MKKGKRSKESSVTTVLGVDTAAASSSSIVDSAVTTVSKPSMISAVAVTRHEKRKRQERMERFAAHTTPHPYQQQQQQQQLQQIVTKQTTTTEDADDDIVSPYYDIIGRNMELEKSYLRLTTYPKCEDVRPLPILIKALDHVKRKYLQNDDFAWCDDQLKSIRQDITVQKSHIPSDHTLLLDVYQTHGRILLEHGKLAEFNQCLSNVLQIYDALRMENTVCNNSCDSIIISGTSSDTINNTVGKCSVKKAEGEFRAYSILYSLVQSKTTFLDLNISLRQRLQQHMMWTQHQKSEKAQMINSNNHRSSKKGKKRRRSAFATTNIDHSTTIEKHMNDQMMNCISTEEQHAWDVVHSIYNGQYTRFFVLYDTAPHMSPYILDFLLHRVRLHAYHVIVASYRLSISVLYVQQSLHFDTLEELHRFLQRRGTVFVSSKSSDDGNSSSINSNDTAATIEHLLIDCRQSQLRLQSP
jgi:hypothetical protein